MRKSSMNDFCCSLKTNKVRKFLLFIMKRKQEHGDDVEANKATINLLAKMFVYMHAKDKERRFLGKVLSRKS